MKGIISLRDYLGKAYLTENLNLNQTTSFHWSNWDQTCLLQKEHYKIFNNNLHLSTLNNSLLELKRKPIWLCNQVEVKKFDLYSLYESYLDSRLRLTWFDRKDEILFSLESEQGPYFALTSMKWFDKDIYSQFVMKKILLDQFTLRSFRLNTSIPVTLKFNNDVREYHDKVSIHQLTEVGIMLKITDKNFVNKIKNSFVLDFIIPIGAYNEVQGLKIDQAWKKLDESTILAEEHLKTYKLESRIFYFYGNVLNAQKSGEKEFYLFARYEDLKPYCHDINLEKIFVPLVTNTKKYFMEDIEITKKSSEAA